MKEILHKCDAGDFEYLSEVLDNYVSLTNDSKRKELLAAYKASGRPATKGQLVSLLDEQIRYFGSADVAYLFRSIFNKDGGVSAEELVSDVCEKLKVNVKRIGNVESRLEQLVKAVVEKELLSKTPDELKKALADFGVGVEKTEQILAFLKRNGKVAVLPVLMQVLGPKVTMSLVEAIVIAIIATMVGREAAKIIVREVLKRNPWLNALGPVVWVLSGAWLAFDLQGPAFRKTVPVCLYLGIVALRDGPSDGDSFFAQA